MKKLDMTPTAMGVVDVESAPTFLVATGELGDHHRAIRLLVRDAGCPIGFITVPVAEAAVDLAEVGREVRLLASGIDARPVADVGGTADDVSPGRMPLSVVVCCRDRATDLVGTLPRLIRVLGEDDELIVVDNASVTSAVSDLVRGCPDRRVRLVREPRPGLARARNAGTRHARREAIVYVDDDVIPDPAFLDEIWGALQDPKVGCVTGLVLPADLSTWEQQLFVDRYDMGQITAQTFRREDRRGPLYPFSPGIFGTGGNLALRRSTYESVGPWDERLGAGRLTRGGEDTDYLFRVIWSGWALRRQPSSLVWHDFRPTYESLRRQFFGYGAGFGSFATKVALDPRTMFPFLARIPSGVKGLASATRHLAEDGGAVTRDLVLQERRGMLAAPFLLLGEALTRGRLDGRLNHHGLSDGGQDGTSWK